MKRKLAMTTSGIILTLCLITTATMAQVTCSRDQIGQVKMIQSSAEYRTIQDSIQSLAYDLFLISETYPQYKYVHHTNDLGWITAVSVVGISDAAVANTAARNLMLLEALGETARLVDPAFLPQSGNSNGMLSKKEANAYKPAPPRMKQQKKNTIVSSSL
jgi:hypothetical protein